MLKNTCALFRAETVAATGTSGKRYNGTMFTINNNDQQTPVELHVVLQKLDSALGQQSVDAVLTSTLYSSTEQNTCDVRANQVITYYI